jgi:hypothetical protein
VQRILRYRFPNHRKRAVGENLALGPLHGYSGPMIKAPTSQRDTQPRAERFADPARALQCDDDKDAFDERLKKLATSQPKAEPKPKRE